MPSPPPRHLVAANVTLLLPNYCAPRYVVDSADQDNIAVSKTELLELLQKPALEGIPVLVLGNKNDLPEAATVDELIEKLTLKNITDREAGRSKAPSPFAQGGDLNAKGMARVAGLLLLDLRKE